MLTAILIGLNAQAMHDGQSIAPGVKVSFDKGSSCAWLKKWRRKIKLNKIKDVPQSSSLGVRFTSLASTPRGLN
jgi:hypothetical protein